MMRSLWAVPVGLLPRRLPLVGQPQAHMIWFLSQLSPAPGLTKLASQPLSSSPPSHFSHRGRPKPATHAHTRAHATYTHSQAKRICKQTQHHFTERKGNLACNEQAIKRTRHETTCSGHLSSLVHICQTFTRPLADRPVQRARQNNFTVSPTCENQRRVAPSCGLLQHA